MAATTDNDPPDSVGSPGESQPAPETYDEFAASWSDPRFTDWLCDRTGEPRDDTTAYQPTRGFATDEPADNVLRQYLMQDYAFVETLAGVFGHTVDIVPTMASKSELVSFLGVLTGDEDDYFLRMSDMLDVPESVYSELKTTPTTRTSIDLLKRTAGQGGYVETLAVLVPTGQVYLSWATATANADNSPSQFYLSEWIDLHAVDDFTSLVEWLRAEFDREGTAVSSRRQRRFKQLFRHAVGLEVAFFDEAYELGRDSSRPGDDRW